MKYLKRYKNHNEELNLPKALIGAGIVAGSLLSPQESVAKETVPTEHSSDHVSPDAEKIKNEINDLFEMRKKNVSDQELIKILDEIKDNLESNDSTKFVSLFEKLSHHIEKQYGYKIEKKDLSKLNDASIGEIKSQEDKLSLFTILGWLGSICLAICGVPQAWMSFKEKHSHGISWGFLLLWAFGEIFALAYVYDKLDLPLLLNYSVNILILAIILYYKFNPKVEMSSDIKLRTGH